MAGKVATLSEKQMAARASRIGASEVGTALGLNDYMTGAELAAVKRGAMPAFTGNFTTRWSQRVERTIRDEFIERRPGFSIFSPGTLPHPTCAVLCATPDGIVTPEGKRARESWESACEIKNLGVRRAEEFENGGIPEVYAVQVQVQLEVTGLEVGWLVPLIGGNDYREIEIKRDREMGGMLVAFVEKWWADHVVQGIPLPVDGSDAATFYLKRRHPADTLPMLPASDEAASIVKRLREAKAALAVAEENEAALSNALRALIGDAAGIEGLASWRANKGGSKTDWEALARSLGATDAQIAAHTTTKAGARVLRLLGGK